MFICLRYSPKERAEIGKFASQHGASAASAHFYRKWKVKINPSTIHSIKKDYLQSVKESRKRDDSCDVDELPLRKRGRPFLLGDRLDRMVQEYLLKLRDGGGVVSARVVVGAAQGIVKAYDKSKLEEFGGHILLNRPWAYSLLKRMKFVQRKVTTTKNKFSVANFAELKEEFLDDVVSTVEMEGIPPELVLNWDQTGIKIVPASSWTMDKQGSKRVEITGSGDKRLITMVLCGSLTGDFLPPQVIYKGKTNRCHPHFKFPSDWNITHSPKHWSNEETMLQLYRSHHYSLRCKRKRAVWGRQACLGDNGQLQRPNHSTC